MKFLKSFYALGILAFLLICIGSLITNAGVAWGIYLSLAGCGVFAALFIKFCFDWRRSVRNSKR